MADIVAVYDDKPEALEDGQLLFNVAGFWVVTTAGEPSVNEVRLQRLWDTLVEKTVIQKQDIQSKAEIAIEAIAIEEPIKEIVDGKL